MKEKEELEIDYAEKQQFYKQKIFELDQRYNDVMKQEDEVRLKMELNKLTHERIQQRLQAERDAEAKLDKEIEKILGRAVTMEDLELLYQQDLKLLNQIEAGLNNKIVHFKSIIAAIHIQRHFRAVLAKKRAEKLRKAQQEKRAQRVKKEWDDKLDAAMLILRAFWRFKFRRNEMIRLRNRSKVVIMNVADEQENEQNEVMAVVKRVGRE
jgi:hypothetical protein